MNNKLTYKMLVDRWTQLCYHYESLYKMAKQCYGLTIKEVNELKKASK